MKRPRASSNQPESFQAISHWHIRSRTLKHSCFFGLSPLEHQCGSARWFFSGKSFYRTAALGLNMQDSPSDGKNMANALAPVCEGQRPVGATLARHSGCISESTQDIWTSFHRQAEVCFIENEQNVGVPSISIYISIYLVCWNSPLELMTEDQWFLITLTWPSGQLSVGFQMTATAPEVVGSFPKAPWSNVADSCGKTRSRRRRDVYGRPGRATRLYIINPSLCL